MSYTLLSAETRAQLEQERLRLIRERSQIISEIQASASEEVDRVIQSLTALINEPRKVEVSEIEEIVESVTEQIEQVAATPQPAFTPASQPSRKTGTRKAKPKETVAEPTAVKAFDAKQLKRKFKGMSPIEAILQVMQEDSGQVYTGDDLLNALYDEFDATEIPRARKALGATLMHATRAGTVKRVGDKPSRFQLASSSAVSG